MVIQDGVFYVANKYTWHAEQRCIKNYFNKSNLKYCTLIIVRIDRNNNVIPCQPCKMCCSIINKYRVRKVICS